MRKLKDALKRIAVIGATMALTLGMAAPATTALAADLAGEVDPSTALEQNQKMATELDKNLETKVTLSFPGKREAEPPTSCSCSISPAPLRRWTSTSRPRSS